MPLFIHPYHMPMPKQFNNAFQISIHQTLCITKLICVLHRVCLLAFMFTKMLTPSDTHTYTHIYAVGITHKWLENCQHKFIFKGCFELIYLPPHHSTQTKSNRIFTPKCSNERCFSKISYASCKFSHIYLELFIPTNTHPHTLFTKIILRIHTW